jgi:hypothetical protein
MKHVYVMEGPLGPCCLRGGGVALTCHGEGGGGLEGHPLLHQEGAREDAERACTSYTHTHTHTHTCTYTRGVSHMLLPHATPFHMRPSL